MVCDVCTDGDIADLEPAKKDAGDWAGVDAKGNEKPASKGCPKQQAKGDAAEESTDEDPAAPEPAKPAPAPPSKKPGDKCSVKNEYCESICVASKCQVKMR